MIDRLWSFWSDLLLRIVDTQTVDRGVALGAQAFTALVPILILFALIQPDQESRDFAGALIERFELKGPSAEALREAFSPTSAAAATQSVSVFGTLLLIVAATSFTRTLQRLYENAFGLSSLGFRGTPWGLLWLGLLAVATTVSPIVRSLAHHELGAIVVAIAFASVLWGVTPYVLTARRITKRQAMPAGLLAGIAMTVLSVASTIWLPYTVAQSASQYGLIGVAFAFVSWLVVAGLTLAFSAVVGATLADHIGLGNRPDDHGPTPTRSFTAPETEVRP